MDKVPFPRGKCSVTGEGEIGTKFRKASEGTFKPKFEADRRCQHKIGVSYWILCGHEKTRRHGQSSTDILALPSCQGS